MNNIAALDLAHLNPRLGRKEFFGSDDSRSGAKRLSNFGAISQHKPGLILDEPTDGLHGQLVEELHCYLSEYRYDQTQIFIHLLRTINGSKTSQLGWWRYLAMIRFLFNRSSHRSYFVMRNRDVQLILEAENVLKQKK